MVLKDMFPFQEQLNFYCFSTSTLLLGHSHSIYVLGSRESTANHWRAGIYDRIMNYLADGYLVAYIGEEDESVTKEHFSRMGMQVEDSIQSGSLTIVNRDVFYSPFIPPTTLMQQWNKLFDSIKKKTSGQISKGFIAIGMPADSFFISALDRQQLVRYESLVAKKYDGGIEAMCLYDVGMIYQLQLGQIIALLNAHQNTGHKEGKLKQWNNERALALIRQGLDAALGDNVTEMVLSFIIRDFEGDEQAVVMQPDQFEKKLQILLGPRATDVVIDNIKKEISKDIAF